LSTISIDCLLAASGNPATRTVSAVGVSKKTLPTPPVGRVPLKIGVERQTATPVRICRKRIGVPLSLALSPVCGGEGIEFAAREVSRAEAREEARAAGAQRSEGSGSRSRPHPADPRAGAEGRSRASEATVPPSPSPSPSPPFAGGEGILVRGERSLRAIEARIADCRLKANSP